MKDYLPWICIMLLVLITFTALTLDGYLTNKARTEIIIACIQSDNCSKSFEESITTVK